MTKSLEVAAKAIRLGERIDQLDRSIAEIAALDVERETAGPLRGSVSVGFCAAEFLVTADNAGAVFSAFLDALEAERKEALAELAALGFAHAGPPQRGTAQELASYVPEGIRRGAFVDQKGIVQDEEAAKAADQSRTAFLDWRV